LAVNRTDAIKDSEAYSFGISQPAGEANADASALAVDHSSLAKPETAAALANDSTAAKTNDLWWKASHAGDDLVVIQVDISSDAARHGAFDKLLAKNQITMEEGGARGLRRQSSQEPSAGAELRLKTVEDGFRQEAEKLVRSDDEPEAIAKEGKSGVPPSTTAAVDTVYVEASPEQIQSTLAALHDDPSDFPSVAVDGRQELRDRLLRDAVEGEKVQTEA